MTMVRDHERTCAQLAASAKAFEAQLKMLRADHDALQVECGALRRCLGRSGALGEGELERELELTDSLRQGSVLSKGLHPGLTVDYVGSRKDSAASGRLAARPCDHDVESERAEPESPVVSIPVVLTPVASTPAISPTTPSPVTSGGIRSPARGQHSSMRASSITATTPRSSQGTAPSVRAANRSQSQRRAKTEQDRLPLSSARGSKPPALPGDMKEASLGASGSRKRLSQGAPWPESIADVPQDFSGPVHGSRDLYELVQDALDLSPDRRVETGVQHRAFQELQTFLQTMDEPPDSWSGPGNPLNFVARAGRKDVARLLLRAKANPNARDSKGVRALHLSTYDGNLELSRSLLVARADVNACDRHGQTPLFFSPTPEVCRWLLEKKADLAILNHKGQSALHLAGRAGLHEVMAYLASQASKSLVDLQDVHSSTARYYAQHSLQDPSCRSSRSSLPRTPATARYNSVVTTAAGSFAGNSAGLPSRSCGPVSSTGCDSHACSSAHTSPRSPAEAPASAFSQTRTRILGLGHQPPGELASPCGMLPMGVGSLPAPGELAEESPGVSIGESSPSSTPPQADCFAQDESKVACEELTFRSPRKSSPRTSEVDPSLANSAQPKSLDDALSSDSRFVPHATGECSPSPGEVVQSPSQRSSASQGEMCSPSPPELAVEVHETLAVGAAVSESAICACTSDVAGDVELMEERQQELDDDYLDENVGMHVSSLNPPVGASAWSPVQSPRRRVGAAAQLAALASVKARLAAEGVRAPPGSLDNACVYSLLDDEEESDLITPALEDMYEGLDCIGASLKEDDAPDDAHVEVEVSSVGSSTRASPAHSRSVTGISGDGR